MTSDLTSDLTSDVISDLISEQLQICVLSDIRSEVRMTSDL